MKDCIAASKLFTTFDDISKANLTRVTRPLCVAARAQVQAVPQPLISWIGVWSDGDNTFLGLQCCSCPPKVESTQFAVQCFLSPTSLEVATARCSYISCSAIFQLDALSFLRTTFTSSSLLAHCHLNQRRWPLPPPN